MPLSLACSSCGAKVRAPDKAAGRSIKCPKCGELLRPSSPSPPPAQRRTTPQTITVSCPHCMTKLTVEAGPAERMASCPMCGGTFPLAGSGGTSHLQTQPNTPHHVRSEEPEELEPVETEPEECEPEEQESLPYDEPWFYGHLEKYAKSLQLLGYVMAAGTAVFVTMGCFWVWSTVFTGIPGIEPGVKTVLIFFLGWGLCMTWIVAILRLLLVGVAAILLAVDAARNLRAIKNGTLPATTKPVD